MAVPKLQDYALVVGIDRYAATDFLEPLNGPKNDVQQFIDWLQSPSGGKVDAQNVKPYMLVSDDLGTTPKSNEIVDVVKKLLALSHGGEVRIGRRLYIFLAGHGVGPDLDDVGLLTAEATEDVPIYVEGRRYANLFRGRAVFDEVVLVMDCCRDFDGELPPPYFPFKKRIDSGGAHRVKRFYAYATGFGRASREKDFGKKVSGIFSHVIISGLEGGAVDGEGRITGASLERYVKSKMKLLSPPGLEQIPEIHGDADLVFADGFPPAIVTATIEATVPHDKVAVLYGHEFKPVENPIQSLNKREFQIPLRIGKAYVFQLLGVDGTILKQDGRTIESVDEVLHVKL